MSFVFLVINNKAVVDYNVVQIFKWSKNLKKDFTFWGAGPFGRIKVIKFLQLFCLPIYGLK